MSEKEVYQGKFVRVTEESIDGHVFERVYLKTSVAVFPITDDGKILFVYESRPHETPTERWKPVTGHCEPELSEEENANKELQEEVGKKAGSLERYLSFSPTGTINTTVTVFIGRDLVDSKIPNPDGEDTILDVTPLSIFEIKEKLLSGELAWGALGYALLRLCLDVERGAIKL